MDAVAQLLVELSTKFTKICKVKWENIACFTVSQPNTTYKCIQICFKTFWNLLYVGSALKYGSCVDVRFSSYSVTYLQE